MEPETRSYDSECENVWLRMVNIKHPTMFMILKIYKKELDYRTETWFDNSQELCVDADANVLLEILRTRWKMWTISQNKQNLGYVVAIYSGKIQQRTQKFSRITEGTDFGEEETHPLQLTSLQTKNRADATNKIESVSFTGLFLKMLNLSLMMSTPWVVVIIWILFPNIWRWWITIICMSAALSPRTNEIVLEKILNRNGLVFEKNLNWTRWIF